MKVKLSPARGLKVVREPGGKATWPRREDAYAIFDAAMVELIKSGAQITFGDESTDHDKLFNRAKFAWLVSGAGKPADDRRGRRRGTAASLIDDAKVLKYARSLPANSKGRARSAAIKYYPEADGDELERLVRRITRKLKSGATK